MTCLSLLAILSVAFTENLDLTYDGENEVLILETIDDSGDLYYFEDPLSHLWCRYERFAL